MNSETARKPYTWKGKTYYIYFLILITLALSALPAFAISVNDLEIVPGYLLDANGKYADIAISPVDKSVHVVWENNYDLYYSYRTPDGNWMTPETIGDGGRIVEGLDEHGLPDRCSAITVDGNGVVHIVFAERDGDFNYCKGNYGNWGVIDEIEESPTSKIVPDIVESQGNIYTIYEEGYEDNIYVVPYINGHWQSKIFIERGEYPSLYKNDTGTIYLLSRNRETIRNALFGYLQTGETSFHMVSNVTDAVYRLGGGPNLAVHNGRLYLAWCDVPGPDGPTKTIMFCGTAEEPGLTWNTKLGGSNPLYYEDTATPHPRVATFDDGTVVYMNARRQDKRYMIWEGDQWSVGREAPWLGGLIEVESDGSTIWVANTSAPGITVFGIRNPTLIQSNDLEIAEHTVLDEHGFSGDIAINPLNGDISSLWVNDNDIRIRTRNAEGGWDQMQELALDNINVYSEDQFQFPQRCTAMDIDSAGTTHIVFSDENGNIYTMNNSSGDWAEPELLATVPSFAIYPDIITKGDYRYVVYHDVSNNTVQVIEYDGSWGEPRDLGSGSHPSLERGENGMVYLLFQEEETGKRYAQFAFKVPGYTDWMFQENVTNPVDELGDSPYMSVGNGKIYIGWNNNTENSGDYKGEIFCAAADEPGMDWTPRHGKEQPLFYENTGDPHIRPSVYSDGSVLLLNGRRQTPRIMVYENDMWSSTALAPWSGGTPQVVNDGQNAWVMVSQISSASSNVSVSAIGMPGASKNTFNNPVPEFTTTPELFANANSVWTYSPAALDDDANPLTWELVLGPDNMTLTSSTGAVEWTPTEEDKDLDLWGKGAGYYLTGIKATDSEGGWQTQYFWIRIAGVNFDPEITSTAPTQAFVDTLYTYKVTATDQDGDTLSFSISEGPETMSIDADSGLVIWTPQDGDEGDHTIRIRVDDGKGGSAIQEYTLNVIKVVLPPDPWFVADTTNGLVPLTVQFTDESEGDILSWQWGFGDGGTSTLQNPLHVFDSAGSYSVSLKIVSTGGVATLIREGYINVYNEDLVPAFSADTTRGKAPLTVQFTDESTGDIDEWYWDFGDSTYSDEQNPQHEYSTNGDYDVKLTVKGPRGSSTLVKESYIQVIPDPPVAMFSAEPVQGPAPLTVNFSDQSEGLVDSWFWNFGDGVTSEEQNPTHTYSSIGTYTVTLVATNNGGSDTLTVNGYIQVQTGTLVESDTETPDRFQLQQNYPNPFNAQTTVRYDLPRAADVLLTIYDINGKMVKTLFKGVQSAGTYRYIWDGTDYKGNMSASGMYILHMQANDYLSDKKIILIK